MSVILELNYAKKIGLEKGVRPGFGFFGPS
jgi:hypothetical protein